MTRRVVPIDSSAGGLPASADLGARSVVLLGLAAVLLDVGMMSNQILSQRQIYRLRPDARARLNTVYMGSAFLATVFGASIVRVAFLLWLWSRARGCGAGLKNPGR
jgi:hypothetical protein